MPSYDTIPGEGAAKQQNIRVAPAVLDAARKDCEVLLRDLRTSIAGLTQAEAEERARAEGPNEIAQEHKQGWLIRLLRMMRNPLVILLSTLSAVSFITGDARAGYVMALMVCLSVGLRFFQEARADAAAEKLKAMIHVTATVVRDGAAREIPLRDLVPGDIVKLAAGDMIPGDVRLLSLKDLFVSQGSLTGESLPVEKFSPAETDTASLPTELKNTCFLGTSVESGTATAVVITTGARTYLGSMAGSITGVRVPTSFDAGLNRFTWLMMQFMAVMVPLVFLINGFTKHDWKGAFFFALAVAVGLTPEMLPMIVSVCLSKGALAMSRKRVIVKRLNSIQNFGGMDILCTDKTGTLTEDRVVLMRHCNVAGRESDEVLLDGYLISHFQTGLKNLLDRAILDSADFHDKALMEKYKKLDELPFDFTRRMMSVMVQDPNGKPILLTKGAPEEVFLRCSHFELDGKVSAMDPDLIVGLKQEYDDLSNDGFRVLAVAARELPGKQICAKEDERQLVLKGYVAFLDPPKVTAARALAALDKHGIAVKILTGDNHSSAARYAGTSGLTPDPMLLGADVEKTLGRRTGQGSGEGDAVRPPLPGAQGARHPHAAGQGARGRFHGRRHQRCARLARGRRRYLGGHCDRHCQRVGRPDTAGEGPHGAGSRCHRGPQSLCEYRQVHPHGRELQLRQHVQRARGKCVPALPADAPDPGADEQSPV